MLLVQAVAPGVGCSSRPLATTSLDAGADASVSSTDPCPAGTAPLRYFVDHGWCRSSYAEALLDDSCLTDCAGYHAVGGQSLSTEIDCFYDKASGALVGGYRAESPAVDFSCRQKTLNK